jgi:Na+/H+ antiporter NhaC
MGAIFSGAAFGDNLAPVSDTTIVSAATHETDVPGVVRSRLKYVMIAAFGTLLLCLLLGGGESVAGGAGADAMLAETADPAGLPMLIPAVIVFALALSGRHILVALTAGIASAVAIGSATGVLPLERVFSPVADGTVSGSAVAGVVGLLPTAILVLLLVTAFGIMRAGGFLRALMTWLERRFARSARGAEACIVALISVANACVSVNTVAMITVGPLANELRQRHSLSPYRSANLLDTISCSFPFVLPYSATIVAAMAIQREIAGRFSFAVVVPWEQIATHFYYGIVLLPVMLVAVVTGFGRERG